MDNKDDKKTVEHVEYEIVNTGKKKRNIGPTLIRILINAAIIAIGVLLILWLVSKAAKYDTISEMLDSMFIELKLMWERIRS